MNICAWLSKAMPCHPTWHHIISLHGPNSLGQNKIFFQIGLLISLKFVSTSCFTQQWGYTIPMAITSSQYGNRHYNSQDNWNVALEHFGLIVSKFCSHNIGEIGSIFLVCTLSTCSHANVVPTQNVHHI